MLEVGQVIAEKYRVERLLGQGGMGAVFEGTHLLIGRRVAVKVLLPEVSAAPEGGARFERELRAAGRIANEHILDVLDAGSLPDGSRFMVSELLEGETLEKRIERARLSPRECAQLTLELLDGLAAAHQAGIVHRDLKPDNIFLTTRSNRKDFVKIIDFGVSKYQFDDPQEMSMTSTGAVVGTPYYLSPEQARGERQIDARSDLYTVGVIMFRCVSGNVPHRADGLRSLLFKIALNPPPPLTRDVPDVEPAFAALVQKAMSRERETRFQSAAEMRQALEAWLASARPADGADNPGPRPPAWSGSETLAAEWPAPTSSNFGRTAPALPMLGTGRKRVGRLVLVAALALLAITGVATAIARHGSGAAAVNATPSTGAPPPSSPAATLPAPIPSVQEVERPPTEPPPPIEEAEIARGAELPPPSPTQRPVSAKTQRRTLAGEQARQSKPASTPTPSSPPTTKPSPSTHQRRDFGY
jgi:serine/threonine-protein kinase